MDNPTPGTAAAPSASTPATPSAPATPAPVPATPSAPVAATPAPGSSQPAETDNLSIEQSIVQKLTPLYSKDGVGGELDPNYNPEDPGDTAAAGDDLPAVGNEGAAEPPVAPAAAEGDGNDAFADFQIKDAAEFGPKALSTALEADPTAAAALEANPDLKAAVFANARKAERAQEYDSIVGSPAEAKIMAEGHEAFTGLTGLMADVKDGDFASVNAVVNAMLDQTILRDDQGNPLKDAEGHVRTSGIVGRFLKNQFAARMEVLAEKATKDGDDQALSAIDILMERAGLRPSTAGNEEEMSEAMKAQKADLDAQQAELDRTRKEQFEQDVTASATRVDSATDSYLDRGLASIMAKASGLDAFTKASVETSIRKELRAIIGGGKNFDGSQTYKRNDAYKSQRDAIERRNLGPGREKALTDLNRSAIETHLPKAARNVFAKANVGVVARQEDRQKTQAARTAAARSESSASLPPAHSAAQPANTASIEQVTKDLSAKLGRDPNTTEILTERMTRLSAATSR